MTFKRVALDLFPLFCLFLGNGDVAVDRQVVVSLH